MPRHRRSRPISSCATRAAWRHSMATAASCSGGWVAVTDGLVRASARPTRRRPRPTIDATDCLVTPGLVNTHHHLFQNLTRAYPPMTDKPLFGWLQSLYPLWRGDRQGVGVRRRRGSAWPSWRCRAARRRPITSTSTRAAPATCSRPRSRRRATSACASTRRAGSMSLSEKDGGLPPDDVVADDDEILAASEDAVARHHDRSHGAMVRIALAPCSPFTVTEQLMVRIGRARRAARRAAAHPLRRERRGRRVLAGDVRLPADGVPRAHRLVHRPHVGRPLRDARRRRDPAARRGRASVSRTARAAT